MGGGGVREEEDLVFQQCFLIISHNYIIIIFYYDPIICLHIYYSILIFIYLLPESLSNSIFDTRYWGLMD